MRTWIVAAHPDDETIGASALLGWREAVTVIHVTGGVPRSPRWWPPGIDDREEYAVEREREARNARAIGGFVRISLGFDDLETPYAAAEIRARLEELHREHPPTLVITHAYEGGHPDHDTIAYVIAGLREGVLHDVPVFEMALYHGRGGGMTVGEFLDETYVHRHTLDVAERARRRVMLRAYRSQQSSLAPFVALAHEAYRPAGTYDFTRPPHEGELLYERMGMMGGERWRELTR